MTGVAGAELRGDLRARRHPGEALDGQGADEPGVKARAAAQELHTGEREEIPGAHLEAAQARVALLREHTAAQAAGDGLGLLVDLLEHVVRELTFALDAVDGLKLLDGVGRGAAAGDA
jgi:hypothetical protein